MDTNHKYDELLNLPHPVSRKHPQMSISARAAQFASFAALNGYEEAIDETYRKSFEEEQIRLEEGDRC